MLDIIRGGNFTLANLIIYLISLFFDAFLSLTYVQYAFRGIQVCVIYLILNAGIKMFKQMKKSRFNLIVIFATIICMLISSMFALNFSTVIYILISGAAGLVVYFVGKIREEAQK